MPMSILLLILQSFLSDEMTDELVKHDSGTSICHMQEHGEFYYLHFIAIVPEAQGQGLFRQLMEPVLTKADAKGKWCYLEASSQKSAGAYQRMGFRHREEWRVWPEANPFYSMERPPQTAVS